jgi:hypothetical protein
MNLNPGCAGETGKYGERKSYTYTDVMFERGRVCVMPPIL